MRTIAVLAGLITVFVGITGVLAQDRRYDLVLGVEDRLRITIYQWGELTGEYGVSYAGTVFLPLIGEVTAAGRTPGELASDISDELRRAAELAEQPPTSVEVIQYRPFYITGEVQTPGAYPYRPGAVLLNAVALAGGYYRQSDAGFVRPGRDIVNAVGVKSSSEARLLAIQVERARIEAELANAERITVPEGLLADSQSTEVAALIARENAVFEARRTSLSDQKAKLSQRISDYTEEVALLEKRLDVQVKEVELLKRDYANVVGLSDAGLVTTSRATTLQLQISDAEQSQTETEVSILRAKQNIVAAQSDIQSLATDTTVALQSRLSELDADYSSLLTQVQTANGLIAEAREFATAAESAEQNEAVLVRTYTILRRNEADEIDRLIATETTPLHPGDIVEISTAGL